jgi:hypothetical protein
MNMCLTEVELVEFTNRKALRMAIKKEKWLNVNRILNLI